LANVPLGTSPVGVYPSSIAFLFRAHLCR
jgi:hypothetical protein